MTNNSAYPRPAIGAIIIRGNDILLIRRGAEPGRGRWSVPGGSVELGETLHEAVIRETFEETGLTVEVGKLAGVYELIIRDDEGISFHYVLIDFFAASRSGEPVAASDASECRWVPLDGLGEYDVTESLLACLRENNLIS